MSVEATMPNTIVSAPATPSATGSTNPSSGTNGTTIAKNFQTFLQLLMTQLKHQNPMDPLNTNQFTQQLVQFAQVEQQIKQNDQLATLLEVQKATQQSQALNYVGFNAAVDGSTANLLDGKASWSFTSPKPATAKISISNDTGQTVYSGNFALNAGPQNFTWDGKGNDGTVWPAGNYTMSIVANDANNQPVSVSTEVIGLVESADMTQNPPTLRVNGQDYKLSQMRRVMRPT